MIQMCFSLILRIKVAGKTKKKVMEGGEESPIKVEAAITLASSVLTTTYLVTQLINVITNMDFLLVTNSKAIMLAIKLLTIFQLMRSKRINLKLKRLCLW